MCENLYKGALHKLRNHTYLEDVILVWNQILDNPTVLGGGEEVGHLVVVGVPRQPGLDDELVGTLASGHQTWPGHSHAGQRHLIISGENSLYRNKVRKNKFEVIGLKYILDSLRITNVLPVLQ